MSLIQIESRNGISHLILSRSQKRNALSTDLMKELCDAVNSCQDRVLILSGDGPVFCAGLDLKEASDPARGEETAGGIATLFRTVSQTEVVTIAAVHGVVAAGGAGLMASCDMVVAAEGTKIGYPEIFRGLVPALLMSFMHRQLLDRHMRELLLLGEYIDVERAREIGLVNRIVPKETLVDEAMKMATQAKKGGPVAIRQTKRMLEEMAVRKVIEDQEALLPHHMEARRSAEAAEGLSAFLEKRPPNWQDEGK